MVVPTAASALLSDPKFLAHLGKVEQLITRKL